MDTNLQNHLAGIYRKLVKERGVLHVKPFANDRGTRKGHYVSIKGLGLSPPQVWFLGKDEHGNELVEYVTMG